jgi:hypothetical protein
MNPNELIEASMKLVTFQSKPQVAASVQAEARRAAGAASSLELRFMRVGLAKGKELEPAGRLAGATA